MVLTQAFVGPGEHAFLEVQVDEMKGVDGFPEGVGIIIQFSCASSFFF
jgi:hypothetical protein